VARMATILPNNSAFILKGLFVPILPSILLAFAC
jgi:hypothetical protein